MTKFLQKSFSVSVSSGGISPDEMERRWEETFGSKKKGQPKPDEPQTSKKPLKKKG